MKQAFDNKCTDREPPFNGKWVVRESLPHGLDDAKSLNHICYFREGEWHFGVTTEKVQFFVNIACSLFVMLLLCGCEMAAEHPAIVLPPSPAGFGDDQTHGGSASSASVQPARDADMEAIKEILSDLQKQISELKSRPPDTTVEPKSVPIPATAPVVFQSGYVYVLTSKTCRVCAQVEKEVKGLANPPFVIVSEDQRPEPLMKWLATLPDFSFPVLYWQVKPNDWRSLFGWPGLNEFLSIYKISKQAAVGNQSAGPTLNPPAAARVHYPLRGNWWTLDGHYVNWTHLTQGEHAGKFDHHWLNQLSFEEVQSLHSDDHQHRVHWNYVVRPQSARRQTQYRRAA